MSESPFSDAVAQLGPTAKGGILIRGTEDASGRPQATAVVAVRVGENFHLGVEFTWEKGVKPSAAGEVVWTF